jgi:hypothetical protein
MNGLGSQLLCSEQLLGYISEAESNAIQPLYTNSKSLHVFALRSF